MIPSQKRALKKLLSQPQHIVIVTHWSPDGDAIGSSLGLYNYLKKKKQKATVITPNDYPQFLHWMPGNASILDFTKEEEKARKVIAKATLIFCLDFNDLSRINNLGEILRASKAPKVMIDHHPQPTDFATYQLHRVEASSTAELVYDFIDLMGDAKLVDKNIGRCLYSGIVTDTGSFRFPSTSAHTHRIVAKLLDAGVEPSPIHQAIYDDNTEDRLRLLGYTLSEKLKVNLDLHTAWITLSAKEHERFHYRKGDTEGVVNYCLSIRGIRFAAFFAERDGSVKCSFRSKGSFDVNAFARAHFNGGGHRNAAGGGSKESLAQTEKKFESLLPQYRSLLEKP